MVHQDASWKGHVRLTIDVKGTKAPEYIARIGHAAPLQATFLRADGRVWRCASRRASSNPSSNKTTISADRGCLQKAPRMRVRATAYSPGRRSDSASSGIVNQQTRPNVVMIMVDDMRADELKYMPWTRRLLGGKGVTFQNSFAPFPLCCPARASTLTGQYTHSHGVYSVYPPWGFSSFDDRSTLATWLRRGGYNTVYLGKYLNGYGAGAPYGVGSGTSTRYVPPGWSEWRASLDGGLPRSHWAFGSTYYYRDTTLSNNGTGYSTYEGKYQTNVYGNLSEQIIRRNAASAKPFFFYVNYTAPHNGAPFEKDDPGTIIREGDGAEVRYGTPARPNYVKGMFNDRIKAAPGASWVDPADFDLKPEYLTRYPKIQGAEWAAILTLARQRAEALYVVDQQVKRTIDALAASGELEETLVAFTSDNGYYLGEQRLGQGKVLPHEPSIRVPFVMRGPGIPAGQQRFDPITSVDWAPTVAELAGVQPGRPVDGMSMLRVARRGDRGWSRAVLTETGPWGPGVRYTDIAGNPVPEDSPDRDVRYAIGIRSDNWLYVDIAPKDRNTPGEMELYDLVNDPNQYHNLAGNKQYARILSVLQAELQRMRACTGSACSAPMAAELRTGPGASRLQR